MHSKYEVIGIVGEGAYGVVYKCKNKESGDFVAIKKFKEVEDELVKKTMTRELRVLQMLKHDNIVEYKEAFKRKGNLFLVFEYVDKNLLELLQEHPKGLDPAVIKKVIYQLCKSIKYLHDLNIVHRDIKPENLLVDSNLKLKLCDFGFARTIKKNNEKLTDYVATRWYRSPELLITSGYYGPEVDYWAIGCIMGELADGDPLFPGDNELDQLAVIQKVLGKLPDYQHELFYNNPNFKGKKLIEVSKPETLERRYMGKLSKSAIHFMKLLLHPDPKQRLKGDAVFTHPYFENYPDPFPSKQVPDSNLVLNNETNPTPNQKSNPQTSSSIDKKLKSVQPIISNTTNINIINYNNFDSKISSSNNPNSNLNTINENNTVNLAPLEKNPHNINTNPQSKISSNTVVNPKLLPNNIGNNMLLTSYNFNQKLKDNIMAMYSSTSFDKNFKTFYKGDPYNFDIDMNFTKGGKETVAGGLNVYKNVLNVIDEGKNKKQVTNIHPVKKPNYKINENNYGMHPSFNPSDKTPPKMKKKNTNGSQGPSKNQFYVDDTYKLLQSKYANFKANNLNANATSRGNNMKDFQLPSINSKHLSLKKLIK